jgi:glycogen operon protein
MIRVDTYPTHKYKDFNLRPGKPIPFGATIVPGGINFSVYSMHAVSCELVLYNKHDREPFAVIPFLDEFRIGNVFTMIVFDLDDENREYGFKREGPFNFKEGHGFNRERVRLEP